MKQTKKELRRMITLENRLENNIIIVAFFLMLLAIAFVFYIAILQSQINDLSKNRINLYDTYSSSDKVSVIAYETKDIYHIIIYSKELYVYTLVTNPEIVWGGNDNKIYSNQDSYNLTLINDNIYLIGYKPKTFCPKGIVKITSSDGNIKNVECEI